MRPRNWLAGGMGFVLTLALLGCGAEPTLVVATGDRLTLYSIDGRIDEPGPRPEEVTETMFRGYPILGKVAIDDPKRRETLVAAFNRGVARGGDMAKCFWPRHALRLEHDGKITDYVICFECLQFNSYQSGKQGGAAIDTSPQPIFNAELERANIPITPSNLSSGH